MRHAIPLLLAVLIASPACGDLEPMPKRMPSHGKRARVTVSGWDVGDELSRRKRLVVDTLRSEGADDARVGLVVAAAMAETNDLSCSGRDASKDGMGDAKNFSAYNMNAYALRMIGWSEGCGPDLNDDANLAEATRLFNRGINQLGEESFMFLHRGGETAMRDRQSYGCQEYYATIKAIAEHLVQDTSRLTDGRRYGCDIAHV